MATAIVCLLVFFCSFFFFWGGGGDLLRNDRKKWKTRKNMGESFQDQSWIQDFEADFPYKVSLKMLNLEDYNSISNLLSLSHKTIDLLNWKFLVVYRHNASFEIWISKVQDFQNFEISPMGELINICTTSIVWQQTFFHLNRKLWYFLDFKNADVTMLIRGVSCRFS